MSVRVMSSVFECPMQDLKFTKTIGDLVEDRIVKASTAKFVLLALADHANDDGLSSYPSITTLAKKTAIRSRTTLVDALDALEEYGYISRGEISIKGTTTYTLHMGVIEGTASGLPRGVTAGVPQPVQPVKKASPATVHEPSFKPSVNHPLNGGSPKPKPTRATMPKTDLDQLVSILDELTGIDRMADANYGHLAKIAKSLWQMKAGEDELKKHFGVNGTWFTEDFRGRDGTLPTPENIVKKLGAYRRGIMSKPNGKPTTTAQERLERRMAKFGK